MTKNFTSALAGLFTLASISAAQNQTAAMRKAQNARASYDRAYQLLQNGKPAEALTEIGAGLETEPSNPGLYNLRGLAAAELGRDRDAETSFRKVIELVPQSAMGYNNLATFLVERGRRAEAAALFRRALEREPDNLAALAGLGVTLAELQDYARAAPYLEKARRLKASDFQTVYEYARVLRELKRPLEAEKVLATTTPPRQPAVAAKYFALSAVVAEDRGDRKRATELYARAYQLDPESFDTYLALVRSSLSAAPHGGAKTEARGGGDSAPSPSTPTALPAPPPHLSAEQNFALGLLLASRGAYAQAAPYFEETLRREPASYSATFNLAVAYKNSGKLEAAIGLVEPALAKKPSAELHNLLAALDETAGRYLDAVRHYQQAVELEPTNEQYYFDLGTEYLAHFTFGPALEVFASGSRKFPAAARQVLGLGLAHYSLRQYREASEAIMKALEIDPSSPSAYAAWNSVAPSLPPAEWKGFLPRLRHMAELHPTSAEALCLYGVTLFRYGVAMAEPADFDPAQSLLERALRLRPAFPDAHLELGNLFLARKNHARAIEQFLEAIREDPHSQMAHYRLGQAYRDLNQLESAERELSRYAELAREHREEMARSRSAIKQFVLAQPSTTGLTGPIDPLPSSPTPDQEEALPH